MDKVELPDFEEIASTITVIRQLSIAKGKLSIKIKAKEAEINIIASNDKRYFVKGKPPTQTYIDNSWKTTGFSNELLPLRDKLVNLYADLEYSRLRLAMLNTLVEVWRTQSANERISL